MLPSKTLFQTLVLLSSLSLPTFSLHQDQAGLNDWHHKYVGSPFQAKFHRIPGKPTRLFVATEADIFAQLDMATGDIVWRQDISEHKLVCMDAHEERLLTLTSEGIGKFGRLRVWDASSAKMGAEAVLHNNPDSLANGENAVFDAQGNIYVLSTGSYIRKVAPDYNIVWTWAYMQEGGMFRRTHTINDRVYTVGFRNNQTLVVSLRDDNGHVDKSYALNVDPENMDFQGLSFVTNKAEDGGWVTMVPRNNSGIILHALKDAADTNAPFLDVYKLFGLAEEQKPFGFQATPVAPSTIGVRIDLPNNEAQAQLIGLDKDTGATTLLDFGKEPHDARSIFASAIVPKVRNTIVLRLFKNRDGQAAVELIDPEEKVVLKTFNVPHSFAASGPFVKAFAQVHKDKDTGAYSYDALVRTADGSIHFFQNDKALWTREESLTQVQDAAFVDLPDARLWSQTVDELAEEPETSESISPFSRFVRRVETHAVEAIQLFGDIVQHIKTLAAGKAAPAEEPKLELSSYELYASNHQKSTSIFRDRHGMRKFLVFLTKTGKLLALDSADKGRIVWERYFGDIEDERDPYWKGKLFVSRASIVKFPPLLTVVDQSEDSETTVYSVNALTGQDYKESKQDGKVAYGAVEAYSLPIEDAVEREHTIVLLDAQKQMHVVSEDEQVREKFDEFVAKFTVTQMDANKTSVQGIRPVGKSSKDRAIATTQAWTFTVPEGETVVATSTRPTADTVASLGRVLGDRTVMYKYLNPHVQLIATNTAPVNGATTLNLYLLDTVSGTLLHHVKHPEAAPHAVHPVHIVHSEHWFVYSFWNYLVDETNKSASGRMAVVLELYESSQPDERVESETFSSYDGVQPHVVTQAFQLGFGVHAAGVTSTQSGITTRKLLFATDSRQIYGVSKRFFDPRRPEDTPSEADKEEQLIPYHPVIPFDEKQVLSYSQQVMGTRAIQSSPALLESTSLVLAHGLDLFFSKESPSGTFDVLSEDFNKGMLLTTIAVLAATVLITAPMVRRKNLKTRWA